MCIYIYMYTHDIYKQNAHICTVCVYTSALQWCLTSTLQIQQIAIWYVPERVFKSNMFHNFPHLDGFREKWTDEPIAPEKNEPKFVVVVVHVLVDFVGSPCLCHVFSFLEPWSTRSSHDFARICFYGAHGRWQTTLSRHFGLDGHWRFLVFGCLVDKNDCWRWRHWMFEEIYLKNTKISVWIVVWLRIQEWRRITWFVFVVDCVRVEFSFST